MNRTTTAPTVATTNDIRLNPVTPVAVELNHGHHRYAFLVDGVLTLDPHAQGVTRNDKGERVSLVPVS